MFRPPVLTAAAELAAAAAVLKSFGCCLICRSLVPAAKDVEPDVRPVIKTRRFSDAAPSSVEEQRHVKLVRVSKHESDTDVLRPNLM